MMQDRMRRPPSMHAELTAGMPPHGRRRSACMRTFFPKVKGMYRYLIMCRICRFIVTKKSTNQ